MSFCGGYRVLLASARGFEVNCVVAASRYHKADGVGSEILGSTQIVRISGKMRWPMHSSNQLSSQKYRYNKTSEVQENKKTIHEYVHSNTSPNAELKKRGSM